MGILFKEDFETGTTTMEPVVTDGCSLEISPTSPISGAYSAKCNILSQPAWTNAFFRQNIGRIATAYAEVLVRIDSFIPTAGGILQSFITAEGEVLILHLGIDSERHLYLMYRDAGSYSRITSETVLELGVAYKINIEVSVGAIGTIRVLVNNVEVGDLFLTAVDNSVALGVCNIVIGAIGGYNAEATVSVDDFIISDTPLPIVYHHLSVDTTPITGVSFTLKGSEEVTPYSADLEEGSYTITMPPSLLVEGKTYNFVQWEDGTTNPERTIDLTFDMVLTATYEPLPTHVLTVTSTPIEGVPFTIEKVS